MNRPLYTLFVVALVSVSAVGCDSTGTLPEISHVSLPAPVDPANFAEGAAPPNAFFPLVKETATRYAGQTPEGEVVTLMEVTSRQKQVQGVAATIVRSRRWLNGELIEDTEGLYAQDRDGNVWCFGEAVKNYRDGHLVDRLGSWESGVDGALAGIMMWAKPRVGSIYYQGYAKGQAEDLSEVLSLNETVVMLQGLFTGCIKIQNTTVLEPNALAFRYYCPGLGYVLAENAEQGFRMELTEITVN